eukprot:CAMPEP_0173141014 /NCGR_PEP_ID=MMETSP1105-20130129/5239_1 /TAXON_ID=2985 /ORGANISM="Ochromonas sp., Strain BG-1" /LENGTH=345 /DNA_ID=CAMNT_0014054131 /DNA_START=109 /DNA_END=1147 /DNA_ORIENTATION=-
MAVSEDVERTRKREENEGKWEKENSDVPACKQFFEYNRINNLRHVFSECFPNEDFNGYGTLGDFEKRIQGCPQESIIFIIADFNYVLSESSDNKHNTQDERNMLLQFLNNLTEFQLRIVAISGYSSVWYSSFSLQPDRRSLFPERLGLFREEWEIWKSNVPVFKALSDEDEEKLKDFTGTVPLYLFIIQKIMENNLKKTTSTVTMEEIFARYDNYEDGTIRTYLSRSSYKFLRNPATKASFIECMKNAITGCAYTPMYDSFDYRYFYIAISETERRFLLPTSGFIRRLMSAILLQEEKTEFLEQIDNNWVYKGLDNSNPSVSEYCFELYCISRIIRNWKYVDIFV